MQDFFQSADFRALSKAEARRLKSMFARAIHRPCIRDFHRPVHEPIPIFGRNYEALHVEAYNAFQSKDHQQALLKYSVLYERDRSKSNVRLTCAIATEYQAYASRC